MARVWLGRTAYWNRVAALVIAFNGVAYADVVSFSSSGTFAGNFAGSVKYTGNVYDSTKPPAPFVYGSQTITPPATSASLPYGLGFFAFSWPSSGPLPSGSFSETFNLTITQSSPSSGTSLLTGILTGNTDAATKQINATLVFNGNGPAGYITASIGNIVYRVQKTVTVADAWRGKPQITIPGFVGVQAVPEPNYSALAAMGGIGLIAAARRRRRKT